MDTMDALALGAIIMAVIIYLYQKNKVASIIPLDKDAERRLEFSKQQAKMESEIDAKIAAFRAKKEQYRLMKEKLNDDAKRDTKNDSNPANNTPADILVLSRPSRDDNSEK